MKKALLLTGLALTLSASASAQADAAGNAASEPISNTVSMDDLQKQQSSFGLDYNAYENGGSIGMDYVISHFLIGGSMGWGKNSDYIKDTSNWDIHLGGNYRYFLGSKWVYVEGRVMIGYAHQSYKYVASTDTQVHNGGYGRTAYTYTTTKNNWEKEGDGDIYLGITPRVGLNLFPLKNGGSVSIVAGYRWNFTKFNFDKEHTADYFTIGIAAIL